MPFSKTTMLNFKFICFIPFGDGEYKTVYELTLLKEKFWGMVKKQVKVDYNISMFQTIKECEDYWSSLIEKKSLIRGL